MDEVTAPISTALFPHLGGEKLNKQSEVHPKSEIGFHHLQCSARLSLRAPKGHEAMPTSGGFHFYAAVENSFISGISSLFLAIRQETTYFQRVICGSSRKIHFKIKSLS